MDFVEDEGFVVVGSIVFYYVIYWREGGIVGWEKVGFKVFLDIVGFFFWGVAVDSGWYVGESTLVGRVYWENVFALGIRKFIILILLK